MSRVQADPDSSSAEKVIIRLKPGARRGLIRRLQAQGADVTADLAVIEAVATRLPRRLLRRLSQDADVLSISTDAPVTSHGLSSVVTGAAEGGGYSLRRTLGLEASSTTSTTVSFRQGVNGYTSTVDGGADFYSPLSAFPNARSVWVEGFGLFPAGMLLRFDNLVGSGPGQIPAGATITSASLQVTQVSFGAPSASLSAHRLVSPWAANDSWMSMVTSGPGLQFDGQEASSQAGASAGMGGTGARTLSGTGLADAVQAWVNGDPNYGWVLFQSSSYAARLATSEDFSSSNRPTLTVTYRAPVQTTSLTGAGVTIAVIDSGLALHLPLARSDVLEQVAVGIVVADLEGRVVDANRAARHLARCADPVGRPIAELVAAATGRKDVVIEARSLPLHSAVAEVGMAALLEDRTEARRAEQRLQLAARLESLGFLTAGIAHEVNNPLAFIRANLSQLEKLAIELGSPEVEAALSQTARPIAADARELVGDTQEGVERIAALVQRLKAFARNELGDGSQRAPVDLGRVVDAAIAMASVGLPRGAIRRAASDAPPVLAIEGDLVQIALNLLVNAVQASADRVDIEVEVAEREGGVALTVSDRGAGIDPDALPHLFEPFFTTKRQGIGSGLGLSLSYDLARRHGGRLEARNRDGGGAAFTLWLPLASASPEEALRELRA